MNEFLAYLRSISLLSDSLARHLQKIFHQRNFARGSFIAHQGGDPGRILFVVKGIVRSYVIQNETEITKWFWQPNDFIFADVSPTAGELADSLQALDDCIVLICNATDFDSIYVFYPEFERHTRVILQRYSKNISTFLNNFQQLDAAGRYRYLVEHHPYLVTHVQMKDLASFLGITQFSLSRIRRNL